MISSFLKAFLFSISLFITSTAISQVVDSIGIDNDPILNKYESAQLNALFIQQKTGFDFTGKKVAFATGSSGGKLVSKSEYFNKLVKPWIEKGSSPQMSIVRLNGEEKVKSGGYDAIVFSWVKLLSNRQRARLVNLLKAG